MANSLVDDPERTGLYPWSFLLSTTEYSAGSWTEMCDENGVTEYGWDGISATSFL
jgi:DUF971 family protein